MLATILIAAAMFGLPGHTDCMCYVYTNRDGSMQVYVSKHFFESLVREKWCIRVYTKRGVHICVE